MQTMKTATATTTDSGEVALIARGLRLSRTWINEALWARCSEHGAAPGVFCFGGALSGVHGLCRARYDRGVAAAARHGVVKPEELASFAQAARNAQYDARARQFNENRRAAREVRR